MSEEQKNGVDIQLSDDEGQNHQEPIQMQPDRGSVIGASD